MDVDNSDNMLFFIALDYLEKSRGLRLDKRGDNVIVWVAEHPDTRWKFSSLQFAVRFMLQYERVDNGR